MIKRPTTLIVAAFVAATVATVRGWDHPGHMLTADIAFSEIERTRPQLIEKIGAILLTHPDTAPFWVAAGEAKGKERVRRMFIECARWADDVKFTAADRPTWHSARWAIVAKDAPSVVREAAAARQGKTAGQAIEALTLYSAMLANPETSPKERALALCWLVHIMGDVHQPMHRTGWAAAALLTLLGVPKEAVVEDYLRSNDYILPAYQKAIDAFVACGGDADIPRAILGVRRQYLEAAFDEMQKTYGTVERYFSEALGIDPARQQALRALYLQ